MATANTKHCNSKHKTWQQQTQNLATANTKPGNSKHKTLQQQTQNTATANTNSPMSTTKHQTQCQLFCTDFIGFKRA
jgi:hypothetical protein